MLIKYIGGGDLYGDMHHKRADSVKVGQAKRKATEALEGMHKAQTRPLWGRRAKARHIQQPCAGAHRIGTHALPIIGTRAGQAHVYPTQHKLLAYMAHCVVSHRPIESC